MFLMEIQNNLAEKIHKAAIKGDNDALSLLMPDATVDDIYYQDKVCYMVCLLYFLY